MGMKRKRTLSTSGSSSKSEKSNERRPKTSVEMKRSGAEESQPKAEIKRRKIVSQRNVNEVKRLISEKADISSVDKDGNTILHRTVLNRKADIVQCILNDEKAGDIIHVVNKEGVTALGIARNLNNQDIVEIIGKKILDDSFKIFTSLREEAVTSTVDESNSLVEPDTKDKIKEKVEICLQALQELTKSEKDIKRFTYKSANVFLFFLETFAIEDVELKKDEKDEFINGCIGKGDNDLVKSIRNYLIHRAGEEIIIPTNLQKFVNNIGPKVDMKRFFHGLQNYTQGVYDKWNKGQSESNKKNLTEILNSNSKSRKQGKTKKDVFKLFGNLVKLAYTKKQDPVKAEEIMFDLIVNIIPLIGDDLKRKVKEVKDLRDDLMHNFHQYKNLDSRMLKIKETIFNVRSKAFHYYSSREIHQVLSEIRLYEDCNSIGPKLDRRLQDSNKEFQENEDSTIKESEAENTFEYVLSQPLFQKKDQNVVKSVHEYLKFMLIIDDEKRVEENQIDDEEGNKTSEQYKELNDAERREIFEDFIKLEDLQTRSDNINERNQRQLELKRKLGLYGIREYDSDKVIKLYIEAKNIPNEQVVKKIMNIIKSVKSLQNSKELENYKISNEDIASLLTYERFTQEKGLFCLDKHKYLLRNYGLSKSAKKFIDKNLNSLPRNEILNISIGDKKIQINIFKVVNNIVRTFYNAYHKYRTEFNDIEALFENEIFLDYLVSLDIIERQGKFEFKDKEHVFIIIKKLLKLEYTAPYIASLLTKVGSVEVIEKDDYIKLIEILLKKDSYVIYLNKLLYVNSEEEPVIDKFHTLYEVYNRILEIDNFNIESMRVILDDPRHENETLNVLGTKIDSLKDPIPKKLVSKIKELLELLNNIALKLIYKGKYEEALKILEDGKKVDQLIYTKLNARKLIESDDSIIIERKLNIAKAKAAQGRENKEQDKLKEALTVLEEIPDTNSPLFLLALSRKAFIHNLLEDYGKAYEEYNTIHERILNLVGGSYVDTTSEKSSYQDLLASSGECKRYLNIVTVKRGIAYCKLMQGNNKEKKLSHKIEDYKEALKIYNEVYNVNTEDSGKEYGNKLPILNKIAFIHSKMGQVLFNLKDYLGALEHHYTELAVQNRNLKGTRKIYGDYYQNTENAIKYTIKALKAITDVYNYKLGSMRTLNKTRAQTITYSKKQLEEDERVAKLIDYIAYIIQLSHQAI